MIDRDSLKCIIISLIVSLAIIVASVTAHDTRFAIKLRTAFYGKEITKSQQHDCNQASQSH